jgi:hypothetical protein
MVTEPTKHCKIQRYKEWNILPIGLKRSKISYLNRGKNSYLKFWVLVAVVSRYLWRHNDPIFQIHEILGFCNYIARMFGAANGRESSAVPSSNTYLFI